MRLFYVITLFFIPLICQAHSGNNFVASDFTATMKPGDKAALLMVHFGTSHEETRLLTIEVINQKVKTSFPDLEVREAYTSRMIIRKLKESGIEKHNPLDALLKLRGEGYTHVIVQSTHIIEGVEMESLRRDVATVKEFFKDIRIGNPLLYTVEDAETVVSIFASDQSSKKNVVLVGHGTYTPITATYAMMDYIFKAKGMNNFHVGTVEGYPTYETVLAQLKACKAKQITLIPFMFVAGDHAKNDIAGDWKEHLEKEGYKVEVSMKGMGEIPAIQDLFIEHIRFVMHHKMLDIMEKKADYAKGKGKEKHHHHH